ncbi:MAG: hypothetical protein M0Z28_01705 [Rhodospirillales bacterium]|nr:hypothetical protein [Rhodospirillales bacterium]
MGNNASARRNPTMPAESGESPKPAPALLHLHTFDQLGVGRIGAIQRRQSERLVERGRHRCVDGTEYGGGIPLGDRLLGFLPDLYVNAPERVGVFSRVLKGGIPGHRPSFPAGLAWLSLARRT